MFDLSSQTSAFLSYCKNRKVLNPKTIKAYTTDLRQFADYTKDRFCREAICDYLAFLHNSFKPKTVKRKIASLKAFTHYLLIEDIIEANPFDKIETSFREPVLLPKTIPLDIIRAMLSAAYSELHTSKTSYHNTDLHPCFYVKTKGNSFG